MTPKDFAQWSICIAFSILFISGAFAIAGYMAAEIRDRWRDRK